SLAPAASVLAALDSAQRLLQALPAELEQTAAALREAEQVVAGVFDAADRSARRDEQQLRLAHGLVPPALMAVAAALVGYFGKLASVLSRLETILEEALDDELAGLDKADIETWHINIGGMLDR